MSTFKRIILVLLSTFMVGLFTYAVSINAVSASLAIAPQILFSAIALYFVFNHNLN